MKRLLQGKAAHIRLGAAGETAAVRMFENEDCDVLMRDYRMKNGEIDLIVRDGLNLVFTEVKTRRVKTLAQAERTRPAAALRNPQKRRIYRAAFTFMREIGKPAVPYRFDLVEVLFLKSRIYKMFHWKSHFGVRTFLRKSGGAPNLFR